MTRFRRWHSIFGAGWLVSSPIVPTEGFARERFEADDGRALPFEWVKVAVGTPDYVKRNEGRRKYVKTTDEEERWLTYTLRSGETLAFRREPPTALPAPIVAEPQGDLFGSAK